LQLIGREREEVLEVIRQGIASRPVLKEYAALAG
jgi:hypothetical protein